MRAAFQLGLILVVVLGCASDAASEEPPRDRDHDGLPDTVEDRNGDAVQQNGETDPDGADTDGDGLPDGVEDENRDGLVGPGETDPTRSDTDGDGVGDGLEVVVAGTDPLAADDWVGDQRLVLLPEPLQFDFVRGLASRAGELEVNSLFVQRRGRLELAPEIEYALAPGLAFELELPLREGTVDALKLAAQTRLPLPANEVVIHGAQAIVETELRHRGSTVSLLWLVGAAPDTRFAFIGMLGAKTDSGRRGALLANPSLFARVSNRLVLGLETNLTMGPRERSVLLLPQLHWEPINHLRVQLGMGASRFDGAYQPHVAGRLVLEL